MKLVLTDRFWEKVRVSEDTDACWEWMAQRLPSGRGRFWINGKYEYPYRLTCEERHGPAPSSAHVASHTVCDNPACVNPNHLTWATQSENIKEAIDKGRAVTPAEAIARRGAAKEAQRDAKVIKQMEVHIRAIAAE